MSEFTIKTYKDSYLYKNKLRNVDSDENKNNKVIMDYITTSNRIDKESEAFVGIVEDIKRMQTSTIVFQILRMDNVVLCIGNYELPRSFKVLEAKDPKNGRKPTIFIDCTGLIEYRNGFYICKKVDVLVAYLYNALVYLIYRYAPMKMINNSDLVISATTCYVSLFTYIIDYLRIIGYAENKSKISYLVGLYFLHNMLGRDLDSYTKNIAARVAGIELKNIPSYDLYIEDRMFFDINEFVKVLAETFRLKGLNLQVFMNKWINLIGIGTQYAVELFTNFGMLLTSAYSGAYIVNQRQIERNCGTNLVKFNNALKNVGINTFSGIFKEDIEIHDKESRLKAKVFAERNNETPKSKKSDFKSIEEVVNTTEAIKNFYNTTKQLQKLPKAVLHIFENGCEVLDKYVMWEDSIYQEGSLCACINCKGIKKALSNTPEVEKILQLLNDKIRLCQEIVSDESLDKDSKTRAVNCLGELRDIKNELR